MTHTHEKQLRGKPIIQNYKLLLCYYVLLREQFFNIVTLIQNN